jgi:hypothetical protein
MAVVTFKMRDYVSKEQERNIFFFDEEKNLRIKKLCLVFHFLLNHPSNSGKLHCLLFATRWPNLLLESF